MMDIGEFIKLKKSRNYMPKLFTTLCWLTRIPLAASSSYIYRETLSLPLSLIIFIIITTDIITIIIYGLRQSIRKRDRERETH